MQKTNEKMEKLLKDIPNLYRKRLEKIKEQAVDDVSLEKAIIDHVAPVLRLLKDGVAKDLMIKEAAEVLEVSEEQIRNALPSVKNSNNENSPENEPEPRVNIHCELSVLLDPDSFRFGKCEAEEESLKLKCLGYEVRMFADAGSCEGEKAKRTP